MGLGDPDVSALSGDASGVIVTDIVGRRPTRDGGVRLDVERSGRKGVVVHAYGAGGRGYELSWGIAGDVASLVLENLEVGEVDGQIKSRL